MAQHRLALLAFQVLREADRRALRRESERDVQSAIKSFDTPAAPLRGAAGRRPGTRACAPIVEPQVSAALLPADKAERQRPLHVEDAQSLASRFWAKAEELSNTPWKLVADRLHANLAICQDAYRLRKLPQSILPEQADSFAA